MNELIKWKFIHIQNPSPINVIILFILLQVCKTLYNLLTLLFTLDAISCKNFNNHILCGACVFGYKSIETGYTSLVAEATVFLQGDIVDYQKIET